MSQNLLIFIRRCVSSNNNGDESSITSTSSINNETIIINGSSSAFCENDQTSEHINNSSETEMKSIPLEEYRKILNATVELYGAKETIRRLELEIQQKNDEISHLQTELTAARTVAKNLSPVSLERCLRIQKQIWTGSI